MNFHFQTYHRPFEPAPETEIESNYIDAPDNDILSELFEHDNKDEEPFYGGVTTEMLEMEVTTLQPTTAMIETTTIPISECFHVVRVLSLTLFLKFNRCDCS
jgi:hypothetical protein